MKEGDRVAQMILERIYTPDVLEVEVCIVFSYTGQSSNSLLQNLDETVRGAGGFGSTGGHDLLNVTA